MDLNESDPELRLKALAQIMGRKEDFEYQKGLAVSDPQFAATDWQKEYDFLFSPGQYKMNFIDGTSLKFKTQEDIYYWVLANVSFNPKFKYTGLRLIK